MAVRLNTLAEIRVLSLASLLYADTASGSVDKSKTDITKVKAAISRMRSVFSGDDALMKSKPDELFKIVGLARQVRIDEDYGTQNIYGIGSPTRPRIVPNNYSVSVTADRLHLDTRNLYDYMSTPEYWYSHDIHRDIGINDYFLYTYMFIRSKEDTAAQKYDIYALMPRSSSTTYTSGDTMVVHNVSLTGFKYTYEQDLFNTLEFLEDSYTRNLSTDSASRTGTSSVGGGSVPGSANHDPRLTP